MLMYANWTAILLAAVASMIVGSIWYSPVLFGKQFMKLSKMKPKDAAHPKKAFVQGFIVAIVMAFVLAKFLTGASTLNAGIKTAAWIWLGFMATTEIGGVIWGGEDPKLFALHAGGSLASIAAMSAVLVYFA